MINWFRSGSPYTLLVLLLYTLVLKSWFLFHPAGPVVHPASDGMLYNWILSLLRGRWQGSGWVLLAQGLLFLQALGINRLSNHFRLFPKNTYFPAMCYLLFSSFFREWNYFSAPLLVNTLMVGLLFLLISLYAAPDGRGKVFNAGFFIGLMMLVYTPACIFLLLLWLALVINRPFKIVEWVMAVVGILTPLYFLGTWLFLTDRWVGAVQLPAFSLDYPHLAKAYLPAAAILVMLVVFLYGLLRMQQHFFKLLIQIRKVWSLLLVYIFLALLPAFFGHPFTYHGWVLALVPLSAFFANACWNIRRPLVANILHGILILGVLTLQYGGML
ncbi:hypothetical protein [Compostibacter hankyongensis]|uniref:EpsG family protein n=1 Tax=Compostibacter hankyongensis TaxID=1007089 RepID=A0ABP8FGL8_9BACT